MVDNPEEKEAESVEKGEWQSVPQKEIARYQRYATPL